MGARKPVASRTSSEQNVNMRLTNAFLANYAEARAGLFDILGAFPEWWDVPKLPANLLVHLVVNLDLEEADLGTTYFFEIGMNRPNQRFDLLGKIQATRDPSLEHVSGAPLRNVVVMPLPILLAESGPHELVVTSLDDSQIARVPILVRVPASVRSA